MYPVFSDIALLSTVLLAFSVAAYSVDICRMMLQCSTIYSIIHVHFQNNTRSQIKVKAVQNASWDFNKRGLIIKDPHS